MNPYTLKDTTTMGQSEPGNNSKKRVIHTP